jgi:hypothetical protein
MRRRPSVGKNERWFVDQAIPDRSSASARTQLSNSDPQAGDCEISKARRAIVSCGRVRVACGFGEGWTLGIGEFRTAVETGAAALAGVGTAGRTVFPDWVLVGRAMI